jgi:hypothetical protein
VAPENIAVHGKINPRGSQKVATMEQPCRRLMSFISSLRAARPRHATIRMDIDAQLIVVVSVPFHTKPGSGYRRNGKVVAEFATFSGITELFQNESVIPEKVVFRNN